MSIHWASHRTLMQSSTISIKDKVNRQPKKRLRRGPLFLSDRQLKQTNKRVQLTTVLVYSSKKHAKRKPDQQLMARINHPKKKEKASKSRWIQSSSSARWVATDFTKKVVIQQWILYIWSNHYGTFHWSSTNSKHLIFTQTWVVHFFCPLIGHPMD